MEAATVAANGNGGNRGGRGDEGRGGRGRGRRRKRAGPGRPAGSRKTQASAQSQAISRHSNSTVVTTSTRKSTRQQNTRAPQGHTSSGSAQAVSEGQSEQTQAPSIRDGARDKTRSTGKRGNASYQPPNRQMAAEREINHLPAHLLADTRGEGPQYEKGYCNYALKLKDESGAYEKDEWYWEERWWEALFNELVAYKQANGDSNVPEHGSGLGQWVREQRESYKSMKIDRVKIARLEEIGFEWLRDCHKEAGRSPTVQWLRGFNDWKWAYYDRDSRQWKRSTLAQYLADPVAQFCAQYRDREGSCSREGTVWDKKGNFLFLPGRRRETTVTTTDAAAAIAVDNRGAVPAATTTKNSTDVGL